MTSAGSAARFAAALALAAALGAPAAPAAPLPGSAAETASEPAKRVAIDYKRNPKIAERSAAAAPATVPDVPDDLKVAPPATAPPVAAQRRAVPKGIPADPSTLGTSAGEAMAMEAAREWGWRQYWRAGFQRGLRDVLDEPQPNPWDRSEGIRDGRVDPRALALGAEIADRSAGEAAAAAATGAVRAAFSDLAREPRRDPQPKSWPGDRGRSLAPGPWAIAPVFDDVFIALPLASAPGIDAEARSAMDGWSVSPAALAREKRSERVYDASWRDPARAFRVWVDRQRPGSAWGRWPSSARDEFRGAFVASFEATLGGLDLRPVYAGYRDGYRAGWRYGTAVNSEWSYRQGYAAGFDEGVRIAAVVAYPRLYERAYVAAYETEFARWAGNPVPVLEGLRVVDANGDGIVEPGEALTIEGDVVNYGGVSGRLELHVDGDVVDAPVADLVSLPARRRTTLAPVALRIAPAVAPRTHAALAVSIADDRENLPVYVSRPLEFEGNAAVDSSPLDGRLVVSMTIANRSRRPLEADSVLVATGAGEERVAIVRVPAGGEVRTEARWDGVRPLDLFAGRTRIAASVRRDGDVDDDRTIAIAPAATDLDDPDFVAYLIALARSPLPDRRDVAEARALALDRMRADWSRAVAMSGNPYKSDVEVGSALTALGELVRAVDAERATFVNRAVFGGLGSDIAALAESLPGAHPLLRKWMKRLAKRV